MQSMMNEKLNHIHVDEDDEQDSLVISIRYKLMSIVLDQMIMTTDVLENHQNRLKTKDENHRTNKNQIDPIMKKREKKATNCQWIRRMISNGSHFFEMMFNF